MLSLLKHLKGAFRRESIYWSIKYKREREKFYQRCKLVGNKQKIPRPNKGIMFRRNKYDSHSSEKVYALYQATNYGSYHSRCTGEKICSSWGQRDNVIFLSKSLEIKFHQIFSDNSSTHTSSITLIVYDENPTES